MRNVTVAMMVFLYTATARADDAAEQPYLVLQSGGHTAPITQVLFTPDGKEVVTVSTDKTVRRWDAATGERLAVYYLPAAPGEEGELHPGALAPDGKTLAVGGKAYQVGGKHLSRVYLLDLADGRVTATLPGTGFVITLAYSHDGKLLAVGGRGQALLLDVASGQVLHALKGNSVDKGMVLGLAFSPDDKMLALASENGSASLWSVETGDEACPAMKHKAGLWCLAWKDDDTLATGDSVGEVVLWDRRGKQKKHFDAPPGRPGWITSLSFLPNKEELFYSYLIGAGGAVPYSKSGGGVLNLVKPEKSREGYAAEHPGIYTPGAVSPDGQLAAVSDAFGVNLWAVTDGKLVRRLAGRGQCPTAAGWGPDGRVVGWGTGKMGTLQHAFDLGELRFAPKPDAKFVRAALSRKSPTLGELRVDVSGRPIIKVLSNDPKKGILATINALGMYGATNNYTFLPGDRLAVGQGGGQVWLYATPTGKLIRKLEGPICDKTWDLAPSPDGRYLLVACNDETLRIWDPEKPEPLLSLFVAGADWVAWTQEGYYAASPAGEKLMGWQVNHGLEQLGTFYPAAQFHKAFYRPDVIKRVLAEGSVAKALEAADKENGKTTEAVSVEQALPPEVSILTPAAGKLDQAEVEVKAQAQSKDRPVVTMHLLMDGRPCPGAEAVTFAKAKAGDKQEAVWKVTLPDGEHHLVALAETDASLGASPEVVVTFQAQEALPTLYVLAVGINDYPGSLKLTWAVDDAKAVVSAFKAGAAPAPYGKVEPNLLVDKGATKEGILKGLDWLKEKMTADDTAVVFYAGHGHRDKKTSQFYMLPVDVEVTNLSGTGVTGTQLKEKFKAMAGRVLVLLDACHSGSIGDSPADPGALTDDVQRQLAAPDCGVVIMCAAMAQEEAGEAAAVKHGFFTAALLSGLGGGAPASKDGLVHLTALNFYVEEEVAELSKDEQHVVVDRPSTVTSFPLVKPPTKADEK